MIIYSNFNVIIFRHLCFHVLILYFNLIINPSFLFLRTISTRGPSLINLIFHCFKTLKSIINYYQNNHKLLFELQNKFSTMFNIFEHREMLNPKYCSILSLIISVNKIYDLLYVKRL